MSKETLIHIVSSVPPAPDGVSDYCYKLWQHWPQPRPHWVCVTPKQPEGAAAAWPAAELVPFALSKEGLLEALEKCPAGNVVLHYVGYAYQKRGMPWWLPGALRAWKKRSGAKIYVMFHELYAQGSPRGSAFWLQPLGHSIVVQLAQLADCWVTSNQDAAERLVFEMGVSARGGQFIPVGSAIEPETPVDFERPWPLGGDGKLGIAVFGLPRTRSDALSFHRELLRQLCERGLVREIALIGKSTASSQLDSLQQLQKQISPRSDKIWQTYSDLEHEEISAVLRQQDIALSRFHPEVLTKSTSYAASCVHGLITICLPSAQTKARNTGLSGSEMAVPHLASDDSQAQKTVEFLRDTAAVGELRTQIKRVALHDLSWSHIVDEWQKVTR